MNLESQYLNFMNNKENMKSNYKKELQFASVNLSLIYNIYLKKNINLKKTKKIGIKNDFPGISIHLYINKLFFNVINL